MKNEVSIKVFNGYLMVIVAIALLSVIIYSFTNEMIIPGLLSLICFVFVVTSH